MFERRKFLGEVLSIISVLFLLCTTLSVSLSEARGAGDTGLVTRLQLVQEAVDRLYGEDIPPYSYPFTGVPERALRSVGLAYTLGALQGWEQSGNWDSPITRGQALSVLFTLGEIASGNAEGSDYRDVRPLQAKRLIDRSESLKLLQPLSEHYFGWNRSLSQDEFTSLLRALAEHLTLPLVPPPSNQHIAPIPTEDRDGKRSQPSRTRRPVRIEIEVPLSSIVQRFPSETLPREDLLTTIWGLIESRFLHHDGIDQQELAYELAEAMIKKLNDPYSAFLRPQSALSFQQELQGEISGIGARVELHLEGGIHVVSPLTGSPAQRAGVRPGDRITHVNGESLLELSLQLAVEKIRGPAGSKAMLTIRREGGSIEIEVTRAAIELPEIAISMQDDVLVVQLFQFGERTMRELEGLIREALKKKPVGMVLDLRNNPGGLLRAATDVIGNILPRGSVVARIKSRDGISEETALHEEPVVPADLPIVVLVNKGSASASEIVAGALQDMERAQVIGTQTFGKGTVQEVVQFHTGESVKLTIAEWLTPLGRSIEGKGITPDVVIEQAELGGRDEQLLTAIRMVKAKTRR